LIDMSEQEAVKLDFSGLKEALIEAQKTQINELKEALKPDEPKGKGVIMTQNEETKRVTESFNRLLEGKTTVLKEQWTVAIPNYTAYETAAHLRDYVWVTEILKGKAGDTVYIPYVKDLDFQVLAAVGNAFSGETTGLISSVSTTLYEAGAWSDIEYYNIEKFDSNLLEQLNQAMAHAAIRAEDAKIMALVNAVTGTSFAGNVTRNTGTNYFYASNVPAALKLLLAAGKDIRPGDCVLYLTPHAYGALLEELASSQVIATAVPSIINQGVVEKYLGVSIVVGGTRTAHARQHTGTGTVDVCYLMRGKRAIAFAPKRDILIETDKQIAARELRITASHTFGVKVLDAKEIVRIWTSRVE
jgi:hypothetical protein